MGRGSSKAGGGAGGGGASAISQFEKSIYSQDQESAMIVTADGQTIIFNGSDENHVFGTDADIAKMNGGTATHNHPNNTIFSSTDVANGISKGNLKEMRIVTKSGEVHTIKNNGASLDDRRAFSANYYNQTMKARNNANKRIMRGETVDVNAYIKNHMENWMNAHASEFNMVYAKGKVK